MVGLTCQETVFGTQYGMKYCDEIDVLNNYLSYPANVPAWGAAMYDNNVSP